jgi:hydroxypyruvate reductase
MIWDDKKARKALRRIFDAAVGSADPALIVPRHLPPPPKGRCFVIGAGTNSHQHQRHPRHQRELANET